MENGRGLIKALENWAKKITSGYREVEVRDLSTSFRDGMAFCAIVHYYRPDLIDFDSLSKENIFENNLLAFGVAEKQLGVPALLDAEDMVKYERPDRLSIITYLSQLRNCFENQNKVKLKTELKSIQKNCNRPPAKVTVAVVPIKRHEVCQVCKHRVFILERLIVDGKLYHTTCFRCYKCDCLLNPGAYIESDVVGMYECSVCLADEVPDTFKPTSKQLINQKNSVSEIDTPHIVPKKEFMENEAVRFAGSSCSSKSQTEVLASPAISEGDSSTRSPELKNVYVSSFSVKDKIHAFEKNQSTENSPLNISAVARVPQIEQSPVMSNSNESSVKIFPAEPKFSSDPDRVEQSTASVKNSVSLEEPSEEKNNFIHLRNVHDVEEDNLITKVSLKETSDVNSSDKNIYLTKTFTESTKAARDIFKISLQPLKLPSTLRKEALVATGENSDIPSVQSVSPASLTPFRRNLSFSYETSNNAVSQSDSNMANDVKLQNQGKVRRSSLESSECDNTKNISKENISPGCKTFNRTVSANEASLNLASNNFRKSTLKTYSPVYKSIFGALNTRPPVKQDNETKNTFNEKPSLSISSTAHSQSEANIYSSEKVKDNETKNTFNEKPSLSVSPTIHSQSVANIYSPEKVKGNETKNIFNEKPSLSVSPTAHSQSEANIYSSERVKSDELKIVDIKVSVSCHEISQISAKEEEYPGDLNPFGEDETEKSGEEYPDDLNPFGDGEEITDSLISEVEYDEAKNPFASDTEDEIPTYSPTPPRAPLNENKSPKFSYSDTYGKISSPSGSLKGTLKKRPAPKPPAVSDIFPGNQGLDSSLSSDKASLSLEKKSFPTSSPKVRKNKPAPLPPDSAASTKLMKETDNLMLKSSREKVLHQTPKKKKRPAPPVPIPMRRDMKKIPMQEIVQEMKEIEQKQREYERQGREIELLIRDKDKDDEASVEEEEYIMQLFELVNQKNALFRRQAELMYIKRSQRLEEQQYQAEKEIRLLMDKPESEKTDADRQKEAELTLELIDIVDQRNSIIDSIEMDRRRELEEDHSVQEQLEIKNGDLPIAAEIKLKSSGKNKKSKSKKEKKKQEEQESGKTTLKRKKLFSKRT